MTASYLESDIEEIVALLGDTAEAFSGKTVLLAGARGFLGRYFVAVFDRLSKHVLDKPCRVLAYDNLITAGEAGADLPEAEGVEFRIQNVVEHLEIDEPVHYVLHAAGIASPFYYRAYPLETLDVAIRGTRNMMGVARARDARITFFSSSEIYGDPDPKHVPTPESFRGNVACQGPRACYDESKRLGETLCYIYHTKYGVETNAIRPFNVYGPGMQETDYRVLPNFASRLKQGLPLQVYGSGDQTRTFCYITDAINGFLRVAVRGVPGEPYNIGNPKPEISMADLVGRIEKALDRPVQHTIIEYPDSYPADEPNRRCPDIRKARMQLGYEPRVTLDDGLRRFLAWTDQAYVGDG